MNFNIEIFSDIDIDNDIYNLIRTTALAVLKNRNIDFDCNIDITITNDDEIANINFEHRQKNTPTDVLSFPMVAFENGSLTEDLRFCIDPDTNSVHLGDMIISHERAVSQATEFGHSVTREIAFLTVHSVLHLLGYDHETNDQDMKLMQSLEKEILEELGILRDEKSN